MSSIRVEVGTPPEKFEGWTTINVCFHGFDELPAMREEWVKSPEFSCFGHEWVLTIYPGGEEDSPEGYAGVGLANRSNTSIKIQYCYSVRDANGKEIVHHEPNTHELYAKGGKNAYYHADFAKRSTLMELLVQGSLVIEVRMKLPPINKSITQFIPTNPIYKNVLELFNDEESADVVFEIGGEQSTGTTTRKRSKTTTKFHAHRLILKNNASALYEMCGGSGEEGITTVSITDVTPNIFKHMIYYLYGGKLSEEELKDNAKDIINACDKYGVVHLKLEAEAAYVKSNEITIDNMMDNLLYADSKNLALLKEAVMDFMIKNKHRIIGKVSFDNVPSSMITDVLTAMARGEEQTGDDGEEDDIKYNKMRVGELRKLLDDNGLDVDGSREAMIALLKENDDSDSEEDDDDDDNDD